jgi:LuxR family maltose regulon positive regulatory protein
MREDSGPALHAPDGLVPPPVSQARPPRPAFGVVERRSLLRRLTRSVEAVPLTLVRAPAGSGKTVLVADWAQRRTSKRPVAWLTMTERDEQPGVFWAHLQLGLVLAGALAADAVQPLFPDTADVDALSDQLLQLVLPVVLVIDAADRLPGRGVFAPLARLLEDAGERLRVIMTTRTEPPLPLHRYRVENRLTEIDAQDLAFSRADAGKLLAHHGLRLPDGVTDDVLRSTEGWAAGVRLAALRLETAGPQASLDGFATAYLQAEVLDRLGSAEREVLARTSVVDELPPGLAPALTGRPDADDLLRRLAAGNAFVVPAEGRPGVLRVHRLVRDLLGEELETSAPGSTETLHRDAAEWFGTEGLVEAAVRHAAAAGSWEYAATLVVDGDGLGDVLMGTTRGAALVEHLTDLPAYDTTDVRLLRAALALEHGDLGSAEDELARVVPDLRDSRRALATAVLRTSLNGAAGRPAQTVATARQARSHLDDLDSPPRLLVAALASTEGAAHLRAGDLDSACVALSSGLSAAAATDGPFRLRCLAELSLAEAGRGRLTRALALAGAAEREATDQAVPPASRPAAAELSRVWVALERQDLAQAQRSLDQIQRLRQVRSDATLQTVAALLRARLMRDRGENGSARRVLEQSAPSSGWLRGHFHDEARAIGAQGPGSEHASSPSLEAPGSRKNGSSRRIDDLLERADARCRAGNSGSAKIDVARALALAQKEHLRRPFAHTSPRIRAMVRNDPALNSRAGWLRPAQLGGTRPVASTSETPEEAVAANLSGRELEVLRHLSGLLTTDEIAAEMFISVNTVRTHVRRILEKLAVSRRHEAVRRGRELGLV